MTPRLSLAETTPDLSDWSERQTRLVKTALREYQSRSVDGRHKLSWAGVQSDIKDITGVDMGGKETLRRFVQGGIQAPLPERCAAIVEFLMHPEVGAMSLEEFLAPGISFQAPIRLLEQLYADLPPSDLESPLPSLCGRYRSEWTNQRSGQTDIRELILSRHANERVLEAREIAEVHTPAKVKRPMGDIVQIGMNIRKESEGWCVFTPEDGIIFFLKETHYGENHSYNLISDVDIWTLRPKESFVVLRYDYPKDVAPATEDRAALAHAASEIGKDLIIFRRVS